VPEKQLIATCTFCQLESS